MESFRCEKCGNIFQSEGDVIDYNSPVYGPCSKKVAGCPDCGIISDEYRAPKQAKSKNSSYQANVPVMNGCGSGGCCCSG
jgi:hypothetical protein